MHIHAGVQEHSHHLHSTAHQKNEGSEMENFNTVSSVFCEFQFIFGWLPKDICIFDIYEFVEMPKLSVNQH